MKKIITLSFIVILSVSCSNAQKKVFTKETLSKMLITTEKSKISFSEILEKHKEKITVIEIWASWCSDCVKAMPKVKEMQVAHPEVNYVFISMDKTYEKWLNGIEKHELKGTHYWVTDGMKGEFGKSIDLDWIPRYIILDKEGKIIIYRAIETDFDNINTTLKELK
jgi:thiol-disulfide isomerase/thioredoxin